MNENQSIVFDYLRFPLTILVIILHAYTATQNVEWLKTGHPVYKFLTYNFSLLWGYLAVPFFFFISGYLFFTSSIKGKKFYFYKWRKRFHTLLVPYLIWNLLTIILYYLLQKCSLTESYFSGDYPLISQYTWKEFFQAFWAVGGNILGDNAPILSPYWYIRNLIILSLLSPVIYRLNVWVKYYWLLPIGIIWIYTPRLAFTSCSIFWFSVGAYLSIYKVDLFSFFQYKWKLQLGLWICCWILFNVFPYCGFNKVISVIIQRLFIILSISILYICIYKKILHQKGKIKNKLFSAAFFIYTVHHPIILAVRKIVVRIFPGASDLFSILLWILSIGITVAFCYGMYQLLNTFFPRLLMFLCGNRNLKTIH